MSVFDAKQFLGDLGFSGAELDELAPKFTTPERVAALEKHTMRQADYSRHMDALKVQQAELAQKEQQLAQEAAEWAALTAQEKAGATTLRQQLEQTQTEALHLRQSLTRVAEQAGVDPKTLLGDPPAAPAVPAAPAAPAIDPSKFASADAVAAATRTLMHLPAQLMTLAQEHQALTGQPLDTNALMTELERRATTRGNTKPVDLRAIWEEQHAIPAKRAEVAEAAVKARVDAAFAQGRESALTESHLPPGALPAGKHAVIFNPNRESAVKRPQPTSSLQGAVNAFATGKYRTGAPTT